MAGAQAVPVVPQAKVQVALGEEKLGHLPPSKARRIVACLKRSEQTWSELSGSLGPESEQRLRVLKSRVFDDLQHQPSKQKLAFHQEIFSAKEFRTVAEVLTPNRGVWKWSGHEIGNEQEMKAEMEAEMNRKRTGNESGNESRNESGHEPDMERK